MKLTVFTLFLLFTTSAFGQAFGAVLNAQPQSFQIPSHPEHASFQPLAAPQNILENHVPTIAQGIQPLWEFPLTDPRPLGDVARELRKEHQIARKAEKVLLLQK